MKARQFEIWIADLNPTMGTEPGKVRPVIIIQTDLLNTQHPSTIICPITTNVIEESEILRVHLKKGCGGLNAECDIMMDQVRAIDNKRLIKKVGNMPTEQVKSIKVNLKIILSPLRKGYENGPQPIHPPPAPPLKREGRGALITNNKIYRNLLEQRSSPPCGQGGARGG